MASPTETVLARLPDAKRSGNGWRAKCPAHEDNEPSLHVCTGDDERCLVKCHAGCEFEDIAAALGLPRSAFFRRPDERPPGKVVLRKVVATYPYVSETGELLFEVVRFHPKAFRPRRPDGVYSLEGVRRVLYRLPAVLAAVRAGERIWLVEGEKDADNLSALGLCATTNQGGAETWERSFSEALRGAHVVLIPDNDPAGRRHTERIAAALQGVAGSVRELELPGLGFKGDVSDWLSGGGDRAQLESLLAATIEAKPTAGRTLLRASDRNFEVERIRKIDTHPPIYYVTVFGVEVKMESAELGTFQRFRTVVMEASNRVPDMRNPPINWHPYLDECMVKRLEVIEAPAEANRDEVLWHHVSLYLTRHASEEESALAELRGVFSNERHLYFHGPTLHRHLASRNVRVESTDLWDVLRRRGAEPYSKRVKDSLGVSRTVRAWRVEKPAAEPEEAPE